MEALTRDTQTGDAGRRPVRSRLRGRVLIGIGLLLTAIGCATWYATWDQARPANEANGEPPIPVLMAVAATRNWPVYLDGLGTVQAFNTVNIKPMVDGTLLSVDVREGQDVHRGDVLARIDPRLYQAALDSTAAKKAQDEARLANARLDAARYQKLATNNYATAQQADTARAEMAQFQAMVDQDQAQIDTAKTQLSYTTITAPIDGRTGIRRIDPGNVVHAIDTTPMLVITQLQPISVVFTLPQQTLPAVAAAMAAGSAQVLALPEQGTAPALDSGTLTVLDNQVDQTTGTIKLKATFPNPAGRLWPGGFVRVRLRTEMLKDALVVPSAAIQRGPRGPYVFVLEGDTAHRRTVTVGGENEQQTVIIEGMKPGDVVVTDGASRLSEGTRVSATGS